MSGNWIGLYHGKKQRKRLAFDKSKVCAVVEDEDSNAIMVYLDGYCLQIPSSFDEVIKCCGIKVPKPGHLRCQSVRQHRRPATNKSVDVQ